MVTSAAVQSSSHRRQFCITASALTNWREKVKNFPAMEDDKLGDSIDKMVQSAMKMGKFEPILDDGEPAKLVHIGEGDDRYFALVKPSLSNPESELAVVTIMTPAHVEKKRQTQWSKPDFKNGLPDAAKAKISAVKPVEKLPEKKPANEGAPRRPTPVPTQLTERKTFLISYIPVRPDQQNARREYEEWGTTEEVESRLGQLKIVLGTLRVYRELSVGYKLIENK